MYPELIEYGIGREPLHKRQANAYREEENRKQTLYKEAEEDYELIHD